MSGGAPLRDGDVLVAVDVGTGGSRASAFAVDGEPLCEMRVPYPTALPRDGWAEQDATRWRSATLTALGRLARELGPRRRIHAIGLTGQCPSVVPLDSAGRPLRMGLIYRDNRATAEAESIRERFGDERLHAVTGHVPAAFHVIAKILWIRAHEPRIFAAACRFVEPSELVATALTGEAATDWTMAAASGVLDLRRRRWASEILDALELDRGLMPEIRPSWGVVGSLRPALARRLGIEGDVPVVAGAGDSIACIFGAGITAPGPVSEMAGSSTCINTVVPEPLADLRVTHYPSAVRPEGYVTETGINTTGEAVEWLAGVAYGGRTGRPRSADYAALDREAAAVPAGADGVVMLPVLGDGERDDPGIRAAVTGLSLRHGRAALARAMLEGVAFAIREHLERLGESATPVTELRVSGGAAELRTWNRIKADVLGMPVIRIPGDAADRGVAMLAGLGTGVYRDAEDAVARACRIEPAIEPDAATHERYDAVYGRYRALAASPVVRAGAAVA